MKVQYRRFKYVLAIIFLLVLTYIVQAQTRFIQLGGGRQTKEFIRLLNEANATFTLPEGFKEIMPVSNDELSYDYGITIPGEEFEIWFSVKPYKQVSKYYANADSAYINIGKAQVGSLSADNTYFTRNLTARVLSQYNANAGKSYLVNLTDSPLTRHYKYALLITMQKDHMGSVVAVCLSNDKGPEFFKYIDKARNCIKFK